MSIARFIDHTILKPTVSPAEIARICEETKSFSFASACVPPYSVREAAALLDGATPVVATVIGFPFGYSHYQAKSEEVKQAIADGAAELDMVINLAAMKAGDFAYLEKEVAAISDIIHRKGKILKLIIESGILSDEEIIACCGLYQKYPVDFMKTSTGYAEKGASVHAVRLMRSHLPPRIAIKASGGIRTFAFASELIAAGATRLGCSASVQIIQEEKGGKTESQTAGY